MDSGLKEQLIKAAFRLKRMNMTFPPDMEINMNEFFLLKGLSRSAPYSDGKFHLADIHSHLCVTRPAVSQMLNSLEKRGYIIREIDRDDRRKISVTLSPKGRQILEKAKAYMDGRLELTISRFGEDNTRQLISHLARIADIFESIHKEEDKGEDHLD